MGGNAAGEGPPLPRQHTGCAQLGDGLVCLAYLLSCHGGNVIILLLTKDLSKEGDGLGLLGCFISKGFLKHKEFFFTKMDTRPLEDSEIF